MLLRNDAVNPELQTEMFAPLPVRCIDLPAGYSSMICLRHFHHVTCSKLQDVTFGKAHFAVDQRGVPSLVPDVSYAF